MMNQAETQALVMLYEYCMQLDRMMTRANPDVPLHDAETLTRQRKLFYEEGFDVIDPIIEKWRRGDKEGEE